MTTFAGYYLTEPADFKPVGSERDLIQIGDDPGAPAIMADTFVELTPGELTAVLAVWNPIIEAAEGMVNDYARSGGYGVPFTAPAPALIKDTALQLAWISGQQRKGLLTSAEANEQRNEIRRGILTDLMKGLDLGIIQPGQTGEGRLVEGVTSSPRIFSRTSWEDF